MTLKKYVGNKEFYRKVLAISVPIMIQNGITNFVNLLDNIMVGSLSTEAMSGVSIVNQLIFVFNILIFGAISAVGIFVAQYHGSGDTGGVRCAFRLKMIINLLTSLIALAVFLLFGDSLIDTFLHSGSDSADLELTHSLGKEYLLIMLIGLVPYAISQVYASTMRETRDTLSPMTASIIAISTNFVLNIVLIFGYLGFEPMGVKGAAIATVVSRFAELLFLVIKGHSHSEKYAFLVGAYRSFYVPKRLIGEVAKRGMPLMMNELLWALATTIRNRSYSTRGLDAVAAQNIANTLNSFLSVVYISLGSAIAIMVGNLLGAEKFDEARNTDRKLLAFSVMCGLSMGIVMASVSTVFPLFYNTSEAVRSLSTAMILISAAIMPIHAFAHSSYYTLRSGGRAFITFVFDCGFLWLAVVPASLILSSLTSIGIIPLFIICSYLDMLKCFIALYLLKKGSWVRKIVVS